MVGDVLPELLHDAPDDQHAAEGLRLVRPPARSHRVLHARRRRADRRPVHPGRRDGDAGPRHDRPRLRLRGLRVLEEGPGHRRQADHRRRGLRHPGHPPHRQDPRQVGRRAHQPRRRRLRLGRLHPHDPAGPRQHRAAQPVPDGLPGLARPGLRQVAARRPRAARPLRQGPDRHDRLRLGRDPDPAAARAVRRGQAGGIRPPRHLRCRELLLRADGPRPRHRAPRHEGPAPAGPRAAPAARGHQRPALHQPRGRQGALRAAVRAVRLDDDGPQPVQVRRRRVLPQEPGRDAAHLARAARGLRQHAAHRRDVRHLVHRGRGALHAPLPLPGGRERGELVRQGGAARPARALPRRHPRLRAGPGRVRDERHRLQGLRGLLPRRRRLHHLGEEERHPGRPGSWLGCRVDVRLRHEDHRPRPHPARADLRAVPQPRAALAARLRRRLRRAPAR